MRTKALLASVLIAAATMSTACGAGESDTSANTSAPATADPHETDDTSDDDSPVVVASTTWVAAFAALAGATDITVIAPSNLQHPPDYDPKASDIAAVAGADFILIAGFEGFADRMREAAGSDAEILQVATEYYPDALEAEVLRLATTMGLDSDEAKHNIEHYIEHWTAESARVSAAIGDTSPVIAAHMYTSVWAALAGIEPATIFGPEPLTPSEVAEISATGPTLVFENSHMPAGADLAEVTGATRVDLVNFPSDDLDLQAVVTTNADLIIAALK